MTLTKIPQEPSRFFVSFLKKLDGELADFYRLKSGTKELCGKYKKAAAFHKKHAPKLSLDRQRKWGQIEKLAKNYKNVKWDESVVELNKLMKEAFGLLQELIKKNNRVTSIRTALLVGTEGKRGKLDLELLRQEAGLRYGDDLARVQHDDLRVVFELFDHLFFDLSRSLMAQQKKIDVLYNHLVADVVAHDSVKKKSMRLKKKK